MRVASFLFVIICANHAAAEEPWWQFLGPHGNGHTDAVGLPVEWTDRENIAWKTPIHDRHLFDVKDPQKITPANTYATPTPAIEKGRVFVHFGTYGTACLDTKTGNTVWTRRDLKCDHEANAGPASSPTIVGGAWVVHVDGRDVQYIIALDKATGKTV